jgi:RNA polymerase sigma-70 factor (ECF subfamily)
MEDSFRDPWRLWYRDHGPALLLYARQVAPTPAHAEDVVQEAFVRTWGHLGDAPGSDPRPLLFLNARRAAIDLARSERSRAARQDAWAREVDPGPALFERTVEDEERTREVERALAALPPEQREVLVLKIWAGLTFEQVGSTLNISPNTAASRYRYALEALRDQLAALHHA